MTDRLSTGCTAIDDLLGGGFERGIVSQVYGPPAAGKTNLALSTAVDVAANGGSALYVDTEGLSVERFRQIARGTATDEQEFETITSRLIISEAHDFEEQAEAVRDAEDVAEEVDLVVLDSATGFYRLERTDDQEAGDALRRVTAQVTHLLSLARKHDLGVIITNQVYTDPDSDRARPLGGHTLEHWSGVVLRLDRFRGGNRRATLEKHDSRPAGETVTFEIVEGGLRSSDDASDPDVF